jgi:hypothetical protein
MTNDQPPDLDAVLARLRKCVDRPFTMVGFSAPAPDAVAIARHQHDEALLGVSRRDLRALLAALDRVTADRDDCAALLAEAEIGARVAQSDYDALRAELDAARGASDA